MPYIALTLSGLKKGPTLASMSCTADDKGWLKVTLALVELRMEQLTDFDP